MKKAIISIFCAILLVCAVMIFSSCSDSAVTDSAVTDSETDAPEADVLRAEDITYPSETLPKVYISTSDGFQVTSKDEYSSCNIRFELNDRYAAFTNTYTDIYSHNHLIIRCRLKNLPKQFVNKTSI